MTEQTTVIQPQDVSDVEIAFPASVRHLMPDYADIPKAFKDHHNPYVKTVSNWFFNGLPKGTITPKAGVDGSKALRHLKCILGSFEPKHEHKEAAVAYLMSLWFDLSAARTA